MRCWHGSRDYRRVVVYASAFVSVSEMHFRRKLLVDGSLTKKGRASASGNVSVPVVARREKASAAWYVTLTL